MEKIFSKKTLLPLTALIVLSCQNSNTNTGKIDSKIIKASTTVLIKDSVKIKETALPIVATPIETPKPTSTPIETQTSSTTISSNISSELDEKSILDLINTNADIFPQESNAEEQVNQATVLNNGGVVFATVLNNGGVVFATDNSDFTTKAILPETPIKDKIVNTIKTKIKEKKPLPSNWIKKLVEKPTRNVKITFNSDKTLADVAITTKSVKELSKFDSSNIVKKISEKSVINSFFVKDGKSWRFDKVSPIHTESESNTLEMESVKFTVSSKNKYGEIQSKIFEIDLSALKEKNDILNFSKGDIVTVEVKASNRDSNATTPISVFARLGLAAKIPLFDDGSQEIISNNQKSGDKIEGDDIYTTNMYIKNKLGFNYITITAVSGDSFDKDKNYLSISKSIPLNIK